MTADDDRLGPAGHQTRHVLANDRLPEHRPAEDVADGAVRRAPHLLQTELLDARLVRRDRRAFDADIVRLDRLGRIDGDLVVGLVTLLDGEIVVEGLEVQIGKDQAILDHLPDDPGHLVPVQLHDRVGHLDLRHLDILAS